MKRSAKGIEAMKKNWPGCLSRALAGSICRSYLGFLRRTAAGEKAASDRGHQRREHAAKLQIRKQFHSMESLGSYAYPYNLFTPLH